MKRIKGLEPVIIVNGSVLFVLLFFFPVRDFSAENDIYRIILSDNRGLTSLPTDRGFLFCNFTLTH